MSPTNALTEATVDAALAGSSADLRALLAHVSPKEGETDGSQPIGDLFWGKWCRHSALHENFLAQLLPLRDALGQLDPTLWIGNSDHPLWELLNVLRQAGMGYQSDLGRAGDKILADWGAALQPLASADWMSTLQRAQLLWQHEQQKLGRLEQRLIDAERGQLRRRRTQQLAARELNRAMGGNYFSAEMAAFVHAVWYPELQWVLQQHGEDSSQWRQRVQLTQRLIASVQDPGADPEARQRLYGLIPEVEAELRSALLERSHDSQATAGQLAQIELEHIALLKARPLPTAPFTLLASDDPWASSAMSISRDLLQQVAELPLGSEYYVRDGERDLRARLILKLEDTGQLLFVNRLGVKALQKSFEEFAYWLATAIVQPLPNPADSPQLLRPLLMQLLVRGERQTRARAEQREREQVELQRRQAAKEKALAEARALAAEEARVARETEEKARDQELQRRREQTDEEYRGDASQRLRQARQIAAGLAIGSWVEFYDEFGAAQRVRLAVKLSSSGKLIFVDREGARRADCERDVFAARLRDGSVRVLDQGPQFEDTLARVVDSLRRDRANRE
jgi:hypothetical protein